LNERQFNGAGKQWTYIGLTRRSTKQPPEAPMTKIKTLTSVMILSAAVATPGFAKDTTHHNQHVRGANNWMTNSSFTVAKTRAGRNIQNFGFSGRDRSYPGGWNPYLPAD
jgi:hypothetical protein